MKTTLMAMLLSMILLFSSCKDNSVAPHDVAGDWQSEEIYVNGKLQADISNSTWLLLKEDNIFSRNYVIGTWNLNKRNLELTPKPDGGSTLQPLQFEVIHHSNASLTLKITLTEREYARDFEGIEADDKITVIEKYKKR